MSKTPYEISDKAIELLNRKAIKRFQKAKSECAALKFDELNVIKVIKRIYQDLKADNQKAFLDLAQLVYIDIYNSLAQEPDLSWLLALLDEYDPVTKYVYEHEVDRKKEYATEAIIAAPSKAEQFRKALSRWAQFTAYYADEVEWKATIKAFKDSGVKKVVWHTQEDERVCKECGPKDGKVYPIDNVPPRPHWGCRCWITKAKE